MPERVRVGVVVTGVPGGERSARCEVVDGRLAGVEPGPVREGDADLLVTLPAADAAAAGTGEYGVDVAFMRGSAKVVGSMGTFMDLLPVFAGDEWRAACAELAAS